jgi:hypothetical protein
MSKAPATNFIPSPEDVAREIDPRTGESFYRMLPADDGGASYSMECTLCREQGNIMSQSPLKHANDCPLAQPRMQPQTAPAAPVQPATAATSRLAYFARPFPSRKGSSAYRSPGPVVHIAAWAMISFLGLALSLPHGYFGWVSLLWLVAGLYLARDLAIYCHYLPVLTLPVLAGCILVWLKGNAIFGWGERHSPLLAIALTLALTALLLISAVRVARATE